MIKKKFKIGGMHCVSCACDIDWSLEDTEGIIEAKTNYPRQQTEVTFEPEKITINEIIAIIGHIDNCYSAQAMEE